jgi:hypothetical protein
LLTLLTIFPTTLEVLAPTPERPAPTPPPKPPARSKIISPQGASDKQVMAYFKQLTGSKLPKKIKVFDKKTGIFKGLRIHHYLHNILHLNNIYIFLFLNLVRGGKTLLCYHLKKLWLHNNPVLMQQSLVLFLP